MINITPCDVSQVDALLDIAIKTYKENYLHLWLDKGKYYLNRFYSKSLFTADLTTSGVSYFLVFNNIEPIGYFKLKENLYPSSPPQNAIEIDKLYILQHAKGAGVGKIIMNRVFEMAKSQDRAIIWLMVMESSPAKTFYENFGFKQTDKTQLDYPNMIDECRWILTMKADGGS